MPTFKQFIKEQETLEEGVHDPAIFKAIFLAGGPGCFAKDTKILMYDGSVKNIQDIGVGEKAMGPDSKPRNILSTISDEEEMYEIQPTKGENWVCNKSHVLTLKCNGRINKDYIKGELYDITVADYLNLHDKAKHRLKLVRCGIDFKEQKLNIDSYYMGLWLGDGTVGKASITTADSVIVEYLEELANGNDLVLNQVSKKENCASYVIREEEWRNTETIFLSEIRRAYVDGEKRIPKDYLVNNRENRIKLLAGLIDSDGYYSNGHYEITTKYEGLKDDILYLCRSLGLASYASIKISTIKELNFSGEYHRITISGNLVNIPVLLERKQASPRKQIKDVLVTGFGANPLGMGEYFGFRCDGDNRFLLGDFTVTHNSGKSFVAKKTTIGHGLKLVNSDTVFEKMMKDAGKDLDMVGMTRKEVKAKDKIRAKAKTLTSKQMANYVDGRLGLVIDGTGKDFHHIAFQKEQLNELGYDTYIVFVNTSLETALARNAQRARKVNEKLVEKFWKQVQANMGKFQALFTESNFMLVDNNSNESDEELWNMAWKKLMKFVKKPVKNPIANQWIKSEMDKKKEK